MTLDASTPPTPTAVTSVAAVLRLPIIFGAEMHWDFPVTPADKTDSTKSRFHRARRGARRVQSKAIYGYSDRAGFALEQFSSLCIRTLASTRRPATHL